MRDTIQGLPACSLFVDIAVAILMSGQILVPGSMIPAFVVHMVVLIQLVTLGHSLAVQVGQIGTPVEMVIPGTAQGIQSTPAVAHVVEGGPEQGGDDGCQVDGLRALYLALPLGQFPGREGQPVGDLLEAQGIHPGHDQEGDLGAGSGDDL